MTDDGNGRVSFTTKELLAEIKADVKRVLDKMDEKADKSSVTSLEARVTTIERQGSPGLEEMKVSLTALVATVAEMQRVQASRAHLDIEQVRHGRRLDSLESWRNRIVGALAVAVPAATAAGYVGAHYLS